MCKVGALYTQSYFTGFSSTFLKETAKFEDCLKGTALRASMESGIETLGADAIRGGGELNDVVSDIVLGGDRPIIQGACKP